MIPDVFVRARPVLVAVAILAAILVVGLLTVGDYGITFDEPIRARSGDAWWHFIATRDRSYLPEGWFANLGAWFDMLGSAMVRAYRALGGHDEYLPRHVLVLLCGLAGMAGTFALARRVLSPWLAVVALVLLALAPRYYGPCFNNPKDIPFAATLVWAIYGIVRLLQEPTRRSALLSGVLAGVCTGVRPFGAIFIVLGCAASLWPLGETTEKQRRELFAVALITGILAATASWPILWVRGPWFLLEALPATPPGTPHEYFGTIYRAVDSPASYAAVWLAITLPLPTLVLALLGASRLAVLSRVTPRRPAVWTAALLLIWVGLPITIPGLRGMPMYSAARHFVFVMPAFCLLAAVGLGWLARKIERRWQLAVAGALLVVSYGDVLVTEVRLHPYEDLYFSRLSGGIRGAAGSFDVAYYGETYREAFEWLAANAPAPVHVNTVGGALSVDLPRYYADKLGMSYDTPSFQYFISQVRTRRENDLPGEVVHTVSRLGVPLAVVVRVPEMSSPVSAWIDQPWRRLPVQDQKFQIDAPGSLIAFSFESPREQTVMFYWGYEGVPELALTSLTPPRKVDLPRMPAPVYPAMVRSPIAFAAGTNVILLNPQGLERSAGLYLQYEASSDLRPGRGPAETSPGPAPLRH